MTVREVMAHLAGLADYFEGPRPDGPTTIERAFAADFGWDFSDVIAWTKAMPPAVPGSRPLLRHRLPASRRRHRTPVDRRTFADCVQARICAPLGLDRTYCFTRQTIDRYDDIAAMRNGAASLRVPLAMTSVQADGGIVSTADDAMSFLDAFFGGRLFPSPVLEEIQADWHRVFRPLEYGTGIMRFRLPRLVTGFRRLPPFIGHSGASGTVMFRVEEGGLTIAGTVNEVSKRSLPYQTMVRTTLAALSALR